MKKYNKISLVFITSLIFLFCVMEVFHYLKWSDISKEQKTTQSMRENNNLSENLLLLNSLAIEHTNKYIAFWLTQLSQNKLIADLAPFQSSLSNHFLQVDVYTRDNVGNFQKKLSRSPKELNIVSEAKQWSEVSDEFQWTVVNYLGKEYLQLNYQTELVTVNSVKEKIYVSSFFNVDFFSKNLMPDKSNEFEMTLVNKKGLIFASSESAAYVGKSLRKESPFFSYLGQNQVYSEVKNNKIMILKPLSGTNLLLLSQNPIILSYSKFIETYTLPLFLILLGLMLLSYGYIKYGFLSIENHSQLLKERLKIIDEQKLIIDEKDKEIDNLIDKQKTIVEAKIQLDNEYKKLLQEKEELEKTQNMESLTDTSHDSDDSDDDEWQGFSLQTPPLLAPKELKKEEDQPKNEIPTSKASSDWIEKHADKKTEFLISQLLSELNQVYLNRSFKEKFLLAFNAFDKDYKLFLNYKQVLNSMNQLFDFFLDKNFLNSESLIVEVKKVKTLEGTFVAIEATNQSNKLNQPLKPFMLVDAPNTWEPLVLLKTAIGALGGIIYWNSSLGSGCVFSIGLPFIDEMAIENNQPMNTKISKAILNSYQETNKNSIDLKPVESEWDVVLEENSDQSKSQKISVKTDYKDKKSSPEDLVFTENEPNLMDVEEFSLKKLESILKENPLSFKEEKIASLKTNDDDSPLLKIDNNSEDLQIIEEAKSTEFDLNSFLQASIKVRKPKIRSENDN